MKLTASEVRIIKNSDCDWDTALRMLGPVKQVFKNCILTEITPLAPDEMPKTSAQQMRYFSEIGKYAHFSKGGASLKKKPQRDQMSLRLKSQNDGLKER